MDLNCCEHCSQQEDCQQTIHFISGQLEELKESLEKVDGRFDKFEERFVTKDAFDPVKMVAYSAVALLPPSLITLIAIAWKAATR